MAALGWLLGGTKSIYLFRDLGVEPRLADLGLKFARRCESVRGMLNTDAAIARRDFPKILRIGKLPLDDDIPFASRLGKFI